METHRFVHFAALRQVFPHADQVAVASQRIVTVFNVRGNRLPPRGSAALQPAALLCAPFSNSLRILKESLERPTMKTLIPAPRAGFPRFADLPDTYVALCALYLPRPIHTAAEARSAAAVIESLAGFPLNRGQADYLEAVAHFADEYDRTPRASLTCRESPDSPRPSVGGARPHRGRPFAVAGWKPQSGCNDSARRTKPDPCSHPQTGRPFQGQL